MCNGSDAPQLTKVGGPPECTFYFPLNSFYDFCSIFAFWRYLGTEVGFGTYIRFLHSKYRSPRGVTTAVAQVSSSKHRALGMVLLLGIVHVYNPGVQCGSGVGFL